MYRRGRVLFELGQIALEDLLRAFAHQQQILCRFSVATAFPQLFDVSLLPANYHTAPLHMASGESTAFVYRRRSHQARYKS